MPGRMPAERGYWILFTVVIILTAFNLFYRLEAANLEFDEARHGINAYEMYKNNEPVVNTYEYQTDYWNLKPPLSYWAIMLGYRIFGFAPLGLRFFSCISALLTVLIVGLWVKKRFGNLASLLSILILSTTEQFILYHCGRSGAADSFYILCTTIVMLSMLEVHERHNYLFTAAFFTSMAFLLKSWHIVAIVAAFVIYIAASGDYGRISLKKWVLSFAVFIAPILLWALARSNSDGIEFFKNMIEYDLLKRTSDSIEGHTGGILYYVHSIFFYFGIWSVSVLPAAFIFFKSNGLKLKGHTRIALTAWIVVPFILYSVAKTKLDWYVLPLYPALAIGMGAMFSWVLKRKGLKKWIRTAFAWVVALTLIGYESFIVFTVSNYKPDQIETAIKDMGAANEYSGRFLYTASGYYASSGRWQQSYLLAAELYGDFIGREGGLKAFIEARDRRSLLLTPINDAQGYIHDYGLVIVADSDGYCLLGFSTD